jgi:hypothetical protein
MEISPAKRNLTSFATTTAIVKMRPLDQWQLPDEVLYGAQPSHFGGVSAVRAAKFYVQL